MVVPESVAEQSSEFWTRSMRVEVDGLTELPERTAEPVKLEAGKAAKATKLEPDSKSSRIHSAEVPDRRVPPLTVPTIEVPRVLLSMVTVPEVVEVMVTVVVMLSPVSTVRETSRREAGSISVQAKFSWRPPTSWERVPPWIREESLKPSIPTHWEMAGSEEEDWPERRVMVGTVQVPTTDVKPEPVRAAPHQLDDVTVAADARPLRRLRFRASPTMIMACDWNLVWGPAVKGTSVPFWNFWKVQVTSALAREAARMAMMAAAFMLDR